MCKSAVYFVLIGSLWIPFLAKSTIVFSDEQSNAVFSQEKTVVSPDGKNINIIIYTDTKPKTSPVVVSPPMVIYRESEPSTINSSTDMRQRSLENLNKRATHYREKP